MRYIAITVILLLSTQGKSQNSIDLVLANVAKNNKSILANQQYWDAKKLLYKTGLNPSNPKFEYEYLAGSGATGGDQVDYYVVQSFDFPTAYIKKNQVANRQIAQSNFQRAAFRQDILLKAKEYCVQLIYLNKRQLELTKRVESSSQVMKSYQAKLDQGEGNLLDLNKAKLQLLSLENELRLNQSNINQFNQKLTEMNGGTEIIFNEVLYPLFPTIPDFKTLQSTIEANDPNLKSIHQQNEIDKKKLELSRAMALPKIEGGYRSQEFAGQKIQGIHLGVTIPLWENKNKVKHQKAHLGFNDLKVEEHHNEHHNEIQQLYEKYTSLNTTIQEYEKLIGTVNNAILLTKAMELGEISAIQYYMELNYFYDSYDSYLQLQRDYYQVIAELYKYEL